MNVIMQDFIDKLENINIGFNVIDADKKIKVAIQLVDYLNKNYNGLSREDIKLALEWIYGVYYECGNIKQALEHRPDVYLIKKVLPIAQKFYKDSIELLPFLYANLHNSNSDLNEILKSEIDRIEKN